MIDIIYQLGDDALDNQAQMIIEPLPFFPNMEALQMRITNFSIPEFSVGSYEVAYKTQKFTKPNGRIETPNTFSFSFRADKYWQLYQNFLVWKNLIGNDATGAVAEDVGSASGDSAIRTNFSVMTMDSNQIVTSPGWDFTHGWLKSLGEVSFDQTSEGAPIIVAVTLEYVKCLPGSDA